MSTVFTAAQTACIGCGCLALGIVIGIVWALHVAGCLVLGGSK